MGPNSVNSQYLDIYMEGNANGWMAVGFSDNNQMVRALVTEVCRDVPVHVV